MTYPYRNWPKRIHILDTSYFITFYTKHRYPYFKDPVLCDLFLENLKICKKLKNFLLFGWVILYEHIHLLLMPRGRWNISQIIHGIKRHISRDANILMGHTQPPVSGDSYPHLRKSGTGVYNMPLFRWQQSFYDRYIRNDTEFNNTLGYIAYNPDKHGLSSDWPYVYTNPKYENLCDEY